MPISKKEFINFGTITQKIIDFMKSHSSFAYMPREVARVLKIKNGTASATMGKLVRKGLLLTKFSYYIYNNPKVKK